MMIPKEYEGEFIVAVIKHRKNGTYKTELCNNKYDLMIVKGLIITELRDYREWKIIKWFEGVNTKFYEKTKNFVETSMPENEIFGVSDIIFDEEYRERLIKRLRKMYKKD